LTLGGAGASTEDVRAVFARLRSELGPQTEWWPQRDGAIEVCAGAILVQHTAWHGAAVAIEALRRADALSGQAWLTLPEDTLGELVRVAGTYRAKARTLRAFAGCAEAHGGLDGLFAADTNEVRKRLLAVRGIGDETADAITLYAAYKPTFVVDAYARRLFERLEVPLPARLDEARALAVAAAEGDVARLQEWHALAVEDGRRRRAYASTRGGGENGAKR
jgi:endonuclease-3 related protein